MRVYVVWCVHYNVSLADTDIAVGVVKVVTCNALVAHLVRCSVAMSSEQVLITVCVYFTICCVV